jgi:ribosomal protein L11 methyltransferase
MYLWRRFATQKWADRNEEKLRMLTGNDLAIVEQADRKRLQFEVATRRRTDLLELARQFGGRIQKLPDDWLKRSLRLKTKPINVGNRTLIIPAGAAFGTGEHATTAMCLRMLEKVTRGWDRDWLVIDLGTGSGILALAAKCLGAKQVVGIDSDPIAISTAKQYAKLNKIRGVKFCVADVRYWRLEREVDVVTANLFSELLIEVAPRLQAAHRVILSGILRSQEADLRQALTRAKFEILEVRRRGKWVAMLAGHR